MFKRFIRVAYTAMKYCAHRRTCEHYRRCETVKT